jgi:hypothetical protein
VPIGALGPQDLPKTSIKEQTTIATLAGLGTSKEVVGALGARHGVTA